MEKPTRQLITSFKKGNFIIRTKPVSINYLNFNDTGRAKIISDYNYDHTRQPVEFIAIANGLIYLKEINQPTNGDRTLYVHPFNEWMDDWALFVVPEGLTIEECANVF